MAKTAKRSKKQVQGRSRPGRPDRPATARPQAPVATESADKPSDAAFPIVGIGASAGGLEALEQFLRNVSLPSGAGYVVVQHLDPGHRGMLVELLQRATPMPVNEATEGRRVERDQVYVIPPNHDLSLRHGVLHVLPQVAPRGLHHPIDFFFRALADDRGALAIGVILSGMGSDGTLGLRAIKERAGAVFVQSPESAHFDGMPRSAIDGGVADVVASAEDLPARIVGYRRHAKHLLPSGHEPEVPRGALDQIFDLLRTHTGNDFSLYKRSTILRRIERRMGLHQIDSIGRYVRFVRDNPREVALLFQELLIGVTSFFRDPGEWEHLRKDVLPALVATRTTSGIVRAWVAGCSTGEEAYSLAIVLQEALEPFKSVKNIAIQVFATDIDRDAIEKARTGLYPDNIAADVSPERLQRYFVREEHGYRISKEIRELVVFAPQNLIMDPPFTKVDVLSCRNLLIYLSAELQKKLIPLFHYALNPGGVLFLGSAETVGVFSNLFAPFDSKSRVYRRLDQPVGALALELRSPPLGPRGGVLAADIEPESPPPRPTTPNLQMLADRVIVQRFSPLGVLCNDRGDVLYISGRAGKYFEPAVGKANLNIFAMAREGLRFQLTRAFAAALRDGRPISVRRVRVGTNGGSALLDLIVEALHEPKELRGSVMVIIADTTAGAPPAKMTRMRAQPPPRVTELEKDLELARGEIQTTREEMQTSQEELKSANEELQSTNEELQSTNEELTTSKEEMQSLNEELQTVNHELQVKVDELSRSNNDMTNLLNSTDIATLFLDGELRVRRFTPPTSRIIKLIPGDVGRPITDIASELDYGELADDARAVLRSLMFKEKRASTRDGRWFDVKIMPYRTLENVIDGVVITCTDALTAKALERAVAAQSNQLRQLAEGVPLLVWAFSPDGSCEYFSHQWLDYTGAAEAEQLRWGWLDQVHPDERESVREAWKAALKQQERFDIEFRLRSRTGTYRWFATRWIPIFDEDEELARWYACSADVEELKRVVDKQPG